MKNLKLPLALLSCIVALALFGSDQPAPHGDAAAHKAHEAYVTAINSNDLDTLLEMLTDDVVFMAPNDKPYIGKAAVRPWLEGYLKAFNPDSDFEHAAQECGRGFMPRLRRCSGSRLRVGA